MRLLKLTFSRNVDYYFWKIQLYQNIGKKSWGGLIIEQGFGRQHIHDLNLNVKLYAENKFGE